MQVQTSEDLEKLLSSYEEALGLAICVKVLRFDLAKETGLPPIPPSFGVHRSVFCMTVKRTRNALCRECDLRDIPMRCGRSDRIRINKCHAGATEIIVPVHWEGSLILVIYIGQFRRGGGARELSYSTPEATKRRIRLAMILQGYFENLIRTPRRPGAARGAGLGEGIEAFTASRLRNRVSLSDVSGHFGLSESRCRHLIKEVTGESFVKLRDRLRLARAKELLRTSLYKTGYIAKECGFPEPQPFYRFFRKAAGCRPSEYREKGRLEA